MNVNEIVQQLRDERGRLEAAIQALEGVGSPPAGKRRGRPPGSGNKTAAPVAIPATAPKRRRVMSAAARKRIADAMRKRWAAAKKSGKKGL
jgi:hypothetical protein